MRRSFRRSRKAVSPVIATIIIVAIAIVMSIAVAYWVMGLGATFTKYEKVQFVSGYASTNTSPNGWNITLTLKNTGTATATVDNSTIFYNGKPSNAQEYTGYAPIANFGQITLNPGNSTIQTIFLQGGSGSPWLSGMTVEVMIQTTSGNQYPKAIVLP